MPRALIAVLVVLAALAGLVGFGSWYVGKHSTVYLVNGTSRTYSVRADGKELRLFPGQPQAIEVDETSVAVEPIDLSNTEPASCSFVRPFYSRLFIPEVFVINLDRAGVFEIEQATYVGKDEHGPPTDVVAVLALETCHRLTHIDYAFGEFPSEIELRVEGTKTIRQEKRRLSIAPTNDARYLVEEVQEKLGAPKARALVLRRMDVDASDPWVSELPNVFSPPELVAWLVERIKRRPVELELHRLYQRWAKLTDARHDAYEEYRALLDKEPGDRKLALLTAEVAPQPADGARMIAGLVEEQAGDEAELAFARIELASGHFADALALLEKVWKREQKISTLELYTDALLANGRAKEGANLLAQRVQVEKLNFGLRAESFQYACAHVDRAAATAGLKQWATTSGAPEQLAEAMRNMAIECSYASGDGTELVGRAATTKAPDLQFVALITAGKLGDAAAIAETLESPYLDLNLYIAATMKKEKQLAEAALERALKNLWVMSIREEQLGAYLAGELTMTPADIEAIDVVPDRKRVLLTAMAMRYPEKRKPLLALAAKLNYSRTFPYRLIEQATAR